MVKNFFAHISRGLLIFIQIKQKYLISIYIISIVSIN